MRIVPEGHTREQCLNPQYHADMPDADGARRVARYVTRRKLGPDGPHSSPLVRVASLCDFGGVMWHERAIESEQASGTYFACPKCSEVDMCGFGDTDGIGPKTCPSCGARLAWENYFQPVYRQGVSCEVTSGYCGDHHTVHNPYEQRAFLTAMREILTVQKKPMDPRGLFARSVEQAFPSWESFTRGEFQKSSGIRVIVMEAVDKGDLRYTDSWQIALPENLRR
jgi:transcription elongation factor Elf1